MARGPKPSKPYDDFPLFPHDNGLWAKKVRGRLRYFGPWADADAALARWLDEKDDLLAGREPRRLTAGLPVADAVNLFLAAKRSLVDAGELTARMWSDYHAVGEKVLAAFGRDRAAADLGPEDFAKLRERTSARLGPVSLGIFIQRVRTIFRWAYETGHLPVPLRYGPGFAKPSRRVVRLNRAASKPKMLTPAECRKLVDTASGPILAMILLGLNCGFGQADCSELPANALAGSWLTFPRPKTGIHRRCWLWPETAKALAAAIRDRPAPLDPAHSGLAFITAHGRPWVRYVDKGLDRRGVRSDAVIQEFRKVAEAAGVEVPGGFYTLRHVFRTVADAARDRVAIDTIMGHADESVGAGYREGVADGRLKAVAVRVRKWLWPKRPAPKK
jgi:integrase